MIKKLFALLVVLVGSVAVAAIGPVPVASAPTQQSTDDPTIRPMLFVHGFMGSGQQFESQALRFTSNGYPAELIDVFEHDSLAYPDSEAQVWAGIDAAIERLIESSGRDQVYLLGHSQGTMVSQGYLNSDPARAARVAGYVNLDGRTADELPGGVPTLAVWGEGDAGRQVAGATNVRFSDQGHTEVVNSPETFSAIYEFFLGKAPQFTEVIREDGPVTISGRVVLFPENAGAQGAELEVFQVEPTTGAAQGAPIETSTLGANGDFGPLTVDPHAHYVFTVSRSDTDQLHHIFLQPFVRSSQWVRVLTSEPDGLANSFWEPSDHAQNLVVMRNEEWWGDQGAANDTLAINGRSVLTADNSPRTNRTIGIFLHDADVDGRSGSVASPAPTGLPFLIGIDLVIPAGDPAPGTTSIRATPRRGEGAEAFCVPALSSSGHRTSVQFNSFHRLLDADGAPSAGPANPTCAAAPPEVDPPTPGPDTDPDGRPSPAVPRPARPNYTG